LKKVGKGSYTCKSCSAKNNIQVDAATVLQIYKSSNSYADKTKKQIPTWKLVLTCGAAAGVGICAGFYDSFCGGS
jgi:hypothetical protein